MDEWRCSSDFSLMVRLVTPVMFPPGRARLSTRPVSTGSVAKPTITMGIVVVACLAARDSRATGTGHHDEVDVETVARRRLGNAAPTGRVPDRLYSRGVGWPGKHPNGERCSRMELFMTGSSSYC